jgi:hypothetical protein
MTCAMGVLALLTCSGCFMMGPPTPSPNNPMNTGRVPSGRKFGPAQDVEKRNKLPIGSLAAEVEMISVDANEICFDLILRTTGERDDMVSPKSWQITIEGSGPGFRTQDFVLKSTHAVEVRSYAEKGNQLLGLAAQACQLAGKCSDDATNKAIYSGNKYAALTGGGVICYANPLKPTSDYVRMRLEDQRAQSSGFPEREFVWEFR